MSTQHFANRYWHKENMKTYLKRYFNLEFWLIPNFSWTFSFKFIIFGCVACAHHRKKTEAVIGTLLDLKKTAFVHRRVELNRLISALCSNDYLPLTLVLILSNQNEKYLFFFLSFLIWSTHLIILFRAINGAKKKINKSFFCFFLLCFVLYNKFVSKLVWTSKEIDLLQILTQHTYRIEQHLFIEKSRKKIIIHSSTLTRNNAIEQKFSLSPRSLFVAWL